MGEILKSLGGMAPPLNCRPLAAGASGFRVRVPAKAADVGVFTLMVRTGRFIKITDGPPIERNDSPSETIARLSYVNVRGVTVHNSHGSVRTSVLKSRYGT